MEIHQCLAQNVVPGRARRRKVLKAAKGNFGGRRKLYKTALQTAQRAGQFAYVHRRTRKRDFRRLWIVRINAAARINACRTARSSPGQEGQRRRESKAARGPGRAGRGSVGQDRGGRESRGRVKPAVAGRQPGVDASREGWSRFAHPEHTAHVAELEALDSSCCRVCAPAPRRWRARRISRPSRSAR